MTASHWWRATRPLNYAHRGGAGLWPENTLFAFKQALLLGCDVIETDVHSTRDGQLVLIHDETVDRTTNGCGRVDSLTLKELRELDAAYQFRLANADIWPLRDKGLRIPTLAEAAAAFPDAYFNIDIKAKDETAERLASALHKLDLVERVLVASSSYGRMRRFRRASQRDVPTSASALEVFSFWLGSKLGLNLKRHAYVALQLPERKGPFRLLSKRLIRAAQSRQLAVHVWTLNTREEIETALALNVAGVITDFPDLAKHILEQHFPEEN